MPRFLRLGPLAVCLGPAPARHAVLDPSAGSVTEYRPLLGRLYRVRDEVLWTAAPPIPDPGDWWLRGEPAPY